MIFCPCGRRRIGRYKNHLQRAYYRCPATEAEYWRNRCEHRYSHRQEILEDAVWNKVYEFILQPENLLEEMEQQRAQANEDAERKAKRIEAISSAISEVDRQLGLLLDDMLTGDSLKPYWIRRSTNSSSSVPTWRPQRFGRQPSCRRWRLHPTKRPSSSALPRR